MKIKKLTSSQKLKLVMGANSWCNYDVNGSIYKFKLSDGPMGVRTDVNPNDGSEGTRPSITYPSTQILAQTWNKKLAEQNGAAIANDCIDNDVDVILAPGVNIKRLPVCGRNFEYYSEDPVVAGLMASNFIKGVQDRHVGACIKHFVANNAESARLFASSDVDERTLREIYLKPFEIAMQSKPWTTMCSYNYVNGTLMANNKKMFDVLRKDLGFDGLIMSDWWAVKNPALSVNSGLDLIMPYNENHEKQLNSSYANGQVDEKMLDKAVENVIKLSEKCEVESKLRKCDLNTLEREKIGYNVAREGMVLLKNDGTLPLNKKDKVVVTGAPSRWYYTGGGSAKVKPRKDYTKLYVALEKNGFDVEYRESTRNAQGNMTPLNGSIISCKDELTKFGRKVAIMCVGNNDTCETEGCDRESIKLSSTEVQMIHYLRRYTDKLIVVVYAGSAIDMEEWIDDASAVLFAGYCGIDTNKIVAEILDGTVNPSGKLTETFPLKLEDTKSMNSYSDPETYTYSECLEVGYRYFETHEVPVLFPFGYGLSYSDFKYSNLNVIVDNGCLKATFDVTNTSKIDGKEIAQLYISGIAQDENRPVIELKGFEKKFVPANSTVSYEINVDKNILKYFSIKTNKWEDIKGKITIHIGKNVRDLELSSDIDL